MNYQNDKLNEIYNDTWPNLGWAKVDSIRAGDTVKFIGCSSDQINWGNNDDPNPHLSIGNLYRVENVYVHSQHTKIELSGIKGKFNSVCFRKQ